MEFWGRAAYQLLRVAVASVVCASVVAGVWEGPSCRAEDYLGWCILGEVSQWQNPGRCAVSLVGRSLIHSSWCILCLSGRSPLGLELGAHWQQGQGWLWLGEEFQWTELGRASVSNTYRHNSQIWGNFMFP